MGLVPQSQCSSHESQAAGEVRRGCKRTYSATKKAHCYRGLSGGRCMFALLKALVRVAHAHLNVVSVLICFRSRNTRRPSSSGPLRFHFNLYLSARYDFAVCGLCCCYIYYYIFIGMLLYELADIYRVSEHYSVCS